MLLAGDFIPKSLKIQLPERFKQELVLANLEGAVCAEGLPVSDKVGVHLHSVPFDIPGRWAFALANNHLMDFREEGLRQTKAFLSGKGYAFAGTGETEAEARKPMFLEEDGKRIAVFSCCERQFGMATPDSAGVAAMGVWLYEAIRSVKAQGKADFVIVSCHAASEFCPWPSPTLRDFYHSLVDAGADAIHGHHAHVPQGWETYKGKPIFYGLGNFVMPEDEADGDPNQLWSLVAAVKFGKTMEWSVSPYDLTFPDGVISPIQTSGSEAEAHSEYLKNARLPFQGETLLRGCWQEASVRLYPWIYSQPLRALPVLQRRILFRDRMRKGAFILRDFWTALTGAETPNALSIRYGKVLCNYFQCESHRDTIATALGVLTGVLPDERTDETACAADMLNLRRQ